jgi:type I restriction enzyme, S subunit
LEKQKQAIIDRLITRGLDENPTLRPSGVEWLDDIPVNYRRTKLRRLCISIRDGTHNPPPAEPGVHRLLSVRNIIGDRFVTRADDRTMSPSAFAQLQASYTVDEGDVVLALVGATTGKSAVVERMENITVQRSIGVLRPKNTVLDSHYLRYVIASNVVQVQIRRVMDKYAAQPGIYLNEVGSLQIIYPNLDAQRELVRVTRQRTQDLDALVSKCSQEISLLREFRTRLIADVVSGKLDVRQAAAELPDEPEEPVAPDVAEVLEGEDAGDEAAELMEVEA